MKPTTSATLFALVLAGCSTIMPSQFDPTMYDHLVALSVAVDHAGILCNTPAMPDAVNAVNRESKLAAKYMSYIDKDTASSVMLVDKSITELTNIYRTGTPSTAYCQLKIEILQRDIDLILTGAGGKSK